MAYEDESASSTSTASSTEQSAEIPAAQSEPSDEAPNSGRVRLVGQTVESNGDGQADTASAAEPPADEEAAALAAAMSELGRDLGALRKQAIEKEMSDQQVQPASSVEGADSSTGEDVSSVNRLANLEKRFDEVVTKFAATDGAGDHPGLTRAIEKLASDFSDVRKRVRAHDPSNARVRAADSRETAPAPPQEPAVSQEPAASQEPPASRQAPASQEAPIWQPPVSQQPVAKKQPRISASAQAPSDDSASSDRVEKLEKRLEEMSSTLTSNGGGGDQAVLTGTIEELARELSDLRKQVSERDAANKQVQSASSRVVAPPPGPDAASLKRLELLEKRLEEMSAKIATPVNNGEHAMLTGTIENLSQQLTDLRKQVNERDAAAKQVQPASSVEDAARAAEVAASLSRLAKLEKRLDEMAAKPAPMPGAGDHAVLTGTIEELARDLAELHKQVNDRDVSSKKVQPAGSLDVPPSPTEESASPGRLEKLEKRLDDMSAKFTAAKAGGDNAILSSTIEELSRELGDLRKQVSEHETTPNKQVQTASSLDPLPPAAAGESGAPPADRVAKIEQQMDDMWTKFKSFTGAPAPDEFPTARITGFTQLDAAWYDQSAKNRATVGDAQDGAGFRRARLAVFGRVAEFTTYQLEVDFATAGRPSFFDTYVDQGNLPFLGNVRAGHFLQPFSVDAMSGFRNLPFLERSLPFLAFVPFRRVAVEAYNSNEDKTTNWAASVFRTGGFNNAPLGDSRFGTDFGDVGGYSFSTRVTHLLYYDETAPDRYLWQIGASYDFSQLGANDAVGSGATGNAGSPRPFYQARTTPEFGPLGYPGLPQNFGSAVNGTPLFDDTGRYEANHFNLIGGETIYQAGAFSAQAEYMATIVDSVAGPVFYQGAYGEVMYRLTGEHRAYDRVLGAFKNPVPFTDFIPLKSDGICGWGSWEAAFRLSFVDLRNPNSLNGHYYDSASNTFTGSSHPGNGILTDTTAGLTWMLNAHTKWQFNWIHAMLDNTAQGQSTADLYTTRVQVDF